MRRVLKRVGIAVAALVAVVAALPFLINVNQFKPRLEAALSAALNREVKLGDLRLSLLAGEITANDLSVAEDPQFGQPAFIRAKALKVGAEIWPFLKSRELIVTYLTIDQPEIVLAQAPAGSWNFSSLGSAAPRSAPPPTAGGPAAAPLNLVVKIVKIVNGRLTVRRTAGQRKPLTLERVNFEMRDFSATTAFPITLSADVAGGGSIHLEGNAGPIDPSDSAATPATAKLRVTKLNLAGSGLNEFAPDVAGVISLEGSASSNGRILQLSGKVQAENLKLARNGKPATRPVSFDFAAEHNLRQRSGALRQGDLHIGGALARITGTYAEQGESLALHLKMMGPKMPAPELQALLPALDVTLPAGSRLEGGTVSVNLASEGPADRLVTAGSLSVDNVRLTGFDLSRKMAVILTLAGIKAGPDTDIETLSADIRVAPDGASAQNLKLVVPAIGDLNGAGTVSPSSNLDFKMTAAVHAGGLLKAVSNTPVPFTVQGTCANPVFRPDYKAVFKQKTEGVKGSLGKAAQGLFERFSGKKK